ncbi:MAG TPA: phenylalanine--tRNA ligase subunit beta, partial [Clostridiales bacterium]|nr:phenylalanine--tRNA ligase subunit beta [Clostridiales bacterium]
CGAPNVREGMIVPFAKLGGQVGELIIKEVVLAGEKSCGMCCSEKELGISDENAGLMELDSTYPLGTDIKDFMDIDDIIFEVDNKSLTNRPDLWGHYGIAREISVLTKRELKPLDTFEVKSYEGLPALELSIKDSEKAYRYSCITVDNIIEKTSPINMKIRLTYCGMRPINLLADLTNYIMIELGQPMHAFDNDIVKSINVKTFDKEIEFKTLDGIDRKIDTDTLMICDKEEAIAIAGIMGGELSEITDNTTSVLLESANFEGVSVRKSATRLGMRTDASSRYEKILDPELTVPAIKRFLKLLFAINPNAKLTSSLTDVYAKKYNDIVIDFDKAYVDKYTGIDIKSDQIEETLSALDFKVDRNGDKFKILVPTFRATKDVTMKADIIEEITRIYGYDNFEIKSTKSLLSPIRHSIQRDDEYNMKVFLSERYSMSEVHSYLWNESKVNREIGVETEENVKIINSLTAENDTLRTSMIPGLLGFVNKNADNYSEMGMYEIGRVIKGLNEDGLCNERKMLGIVFASKVLNEKEVYFKMKEIIDNLIYQIKARYPKYELSDEIAKYNYIHPVNSAIIKLNQIETGYFSLINPRIRNKIDKKLNIAYAEIDLMEFEAIDAEHRKYKEVSKYPGVEVDLSLLVDSDIRYGEIISYIDNNQYDNLVEVDLVDIFTDEKNLPGKKSVTIRFEFGSMDRTLKSEEISKVTDEILGDLKEKGINLR